MAKLTFSQRYRENLRFRQAVDDLHREAVFAIVGLDPEAINESWDGEQLTIEVPVAKEAPASPAKSTATRSSGGTKRSTSKK